MVIRRAATTCLRVVRGLAIVGALAVQIVHWLHGTGIPFPIRGFAAVALFAQTGLSLADWLWNDGLLSRAIVPFMLMSVAIVSLSLRQDGYWFAPLAGICELAFVLTIVLLALARRRDAHVRLPIEDRLKDAFGLLVNAEIATFLAKEVTVVFAAFRFLAAPLGTPMKSAGAFSYRDSPTLLLLPALAIFVIPEMVVVHLFLMQHQVISTIVLIAEVYAMIWGLGVFQLFRERPHIVDEDKVLFQCGVFKRASVDLRQIREVKVRPIADERERRRLRQCGYNMTLPDVPILEITLSDAMPFPSGLLGRMRTYSRIFVSADAPSAFANALSMK